MNYAVQAVSTVRSFAAFAEQIAGEVMPAYREMTRESRLSTAERKSLRIAQKRAYHAEKAAAQRENLLFETVYTAYCRLARPENAVPYADIPLHQDACQAVYDWYEREYASLPAGKRGSSQNARKVNRNTEDYQFAHRYTIDSFELYMVAVRDIREIDAYDYGFTIEPQPEREFILHLALAFHLSHKELERLLSHYRHYPLHVKNIHDLAVFAALLSGEKNLFDTAGRLYLAARKVLSEPDPAVPEHIVTPQEAAAFLGSTTSIHDFLLLTIAARNGQPAHRLTAESYLGYIGAHREIYNWRHSKLLRSHCLLAESIDGYFRLDDTGDLRQYGPYAFCARFCGIGNLKENSAPGGNWEQNFKKSIYREETHPTREAMILLWLYRACLTYADSLPVSEAHRDYIAQLSGKKTRARDDRNLCCNYPQMKDLFAEAAAAIRCGLDESGETVSLAACLYGENHRPAEFWDGAAVTSHIDAQLTAHGLAPLSAKLPFDRVILALKPLKYYPAAGTYGGRQIAHCNTVVYQDRIRVILDYEHAGNAADVAMVRAMQEKNVPAPLVLVFALFEKMQACKQDLLWHQYCRQLALESKQQDSDGIPDDEREAAEAMRGLLRERMDRTEDKAERARLKKLIAQNPDIPLLKCRLYETL